MKSAKWIFVIYAAAAFPLQRNSEEDFAHMCIVTSPRETPYVQDTAAATLAQLPAGFSMSVVSMDDNDDIPDGILVRRLRRIAANCTDADPPCSVRQQGLDIVNALELCHTERPHAQWIVLLEDDFAPCGDGALKELRQSLLSVSTQLKFVRFTQGGGGIAFQRESVPPYARYVREHNDEMPHDRALIMPWSALPDMVLPTHLFKHIGAVSTIAYRNNESFTRQYASIRENECGSPITV